jgi:hypothetical protein
MAKDVVNAQKLNLRQDCMAFKVSQSCFCYERKLSKTMSGLPVYCLV